MSFLNFCFSSNWEREREWYTKFGYKGETSPKLLILFFHGVPLENLFFFHGLIDFVLFFFTGLKNLRSLRSQIFFCLPPGVKWLWLVCPLRTLLKNWLSYYLLPLRGRGPHFRFEVPANHLASLFSPLVSGDLRLLSTNTCWYPSVTYILP